MADEEVKEVTTEFNPTVTAPPPSTPEWLDRKTWELELRKALRAEYEELFKLWKTTDLLELEKKNKELIDSGLEKLYVKYKESQVPPDHAALQQILSQEYETFAVQIGKDNSRVFTLCELSAKAERRFYNMFKERLLSKAPELQALTQAGIDMKFEDRVKAILGLFDDTFDVMADAVVICLNPYEEDKEINREWVQNNISSNRQWSIVEAQIGVNKLKDFFLRLFQSGQSMQTTMTGASSQLLQQLVR